MHTNTSFDGDMVTAATSLVATDAHILCGCLVAAGVAATVADANLGQTHSLLTAALGGIRILVPEADLQRAQDIIAAFNRGDYQLDDNADVGQARDASQD
jgi:hypothetical protein